MLKSRNLDDQTYISIMEYIYGRLPWICPGWTDYNAHDPGITILELMSWYKEMQQYHMNKVTDAMKREFLHLVGFPPEPPSPAWCYIDLPMDFNEKQKLTRLYTDAGVAFEFAEHASKSAELRAVYAKKDESEVRLTDVIGQPGISVSPFTHLGEDTSFYLGFRNVISDSLKIWFDISDNYPVSRNAFIEKQQPPRIIEWSFVGESTSENTSDIKTEPLFDETYALSKSGYVKLQIPKKWISATVGGEKMKFLKLSLLDAGCEETVRIKDIRLGRHIVIQKETWSDLKYLHAPEDSNYTITLTDALFGKGILYVFVRRGDLLTQTTYEVEQQTQLHRTIRLDTTGAVQDGKENLVIAGIDPMHIDELIYNSTGLPDMSLPLPLRGKRILDIGLICETKNTGDTEMQNIWRYSDNLTSANHGEHIFGCDKKRELLVFGDGERGGIVPKGERTILIAPFVLSYDHEGNIPEGTMYFEEDGKTVKNTAASFGAKEQTIDDAYSAFLKKLESPQKCVSGKDLESAALATPGLRVAAVKAIAGYDPDEPTGKSALPTVTIVAVPYNGVSRASPDRRFLGRIYKHLDAFRTICTKIKVIAPQYKPVDIIVSARSKKPGTEEKIKECVKEYLEISSSRGIGDAIIKNDLLSQIMKIDGVYKIERLEQRSPQSGLYINAAGDIITPLDAIVWLNEIHVNVRL